ncbi:MAG TPA: 16S rRNA (uracil(1498)-N(3))-methyltransferase [Gammaproteobacteria bacterium]|nr:16S rRNA (uracil(1498)-N(3))-methyltransferase [Gammaproteobacteria bacterium]
MRTPRIHCDQPLRAGNTVDLDGQAARHVARVLRLGPGAALVLFDGRGGEFGAHVESVAREVVTVRVGARRDPQGESPLAISLIQGISRGERMDYAVQKAVELGVTRIDPVFCTRSMVRLPGERLVRRRNHWQGVARSACEQCGRAVVPEVTMPRPLDERLAQDPGDGTRLLLDPAAGTRLADLPPPARATLLVGPEGGLDDAEAARARECGFTAVRMGPRTLRTETAAAAAIAVMQGLWGDM